jgi:PPOX class probable F420-dependent enzyme
MLSAAERRFLEAQRIAYLATADAQAVPHVIPVCFALGDKTLYVTIDEKPKRPGGPLLKRLSNIRQNPRVAIVADHYDEDWAKLGWIMLRGRAEILIGGDEHAQAQTLLRARYRQLSAMNIAPHPVIAARLERVTSWGTLSVDRLAQPDLASLTRERE